jgi:hypothetical protein
MDAHGDIILGTTTRGLAGEIPVTISQSDRRRHLHIVGRTGTGKTNLLANLILDDLYAGRGFAVLDPHGDLALQIIDAVPPERTNDVLYFDPSDIAHPCAINPLDRVAPDQRPLVSAHLVSAFKHLFAESWGPRLEYVLLNSLRLLLDSPSPNLVALPRLLVDDAYRARLIAHCNDPVILLFWTREFAEYSERFAVEVMTPLQNKIGAFLAVPFLRNILGQQRSTIDIPRIMNDGRVLVANLAKGKLGEAPTHLLGAFLASAFAQAAEARAAIPEQERRDFYLFCDEFQNFATDSFATILSEARKWRLSLTLAHQYLAQMPDRLRQAVLANAGSLITFRCGAEDAAVFAKEFGIDSTSAFTDCPNFTAWAKLMQNGLPSDPMQIETLFSQPRFWNRSPAVIARTRARHTRDRAIVERNIARRLGFSELSERS